MEMYGDRSGFLLMGIATKRVNIKYYSYIDSQAYKWQIERRNLAVS